MRRVTLDSNVLVYASLEPQTDKGRRAAWVIGAAAARGVLAAQVLGEFLNVVRWRAPDLVHLAVQQVDDLMSTYVIAATNGPVIRAAGGLALRHRLQFWDAVILVAVREAGADVFLSEDLQDGWVAEGMTVINPFAERNGVSIAGSWALRRQWTASACADAHETIRVRSSGEKPCAAERIALCFSQLVSDASVSGCCFADGVACSFPE